MAPDVDWPNALEGGRERGHEAVREYWERQFRRIDSRVEPLRFATDPEGRIVVEVRQVVRDPGGELLSDGTVHHVFTLRDGLVARMDIREEEEGD